MNLSSQYNLLSIVAELHRRVELCVKGFSPTGHNQGNGLDLFFKTLFKQVWWSGASEGSPRVYDFNGPSRFDLRVPTAYYNNVVGGAIPLNPISPGSYREEVVTEEAELKMLNLPTMLETQKFQYNLREVRRIQNSNLWDIFMTGCVDSPLSVGFHGPLDRENMESILTYGFAPHRCRTGAFSPGTYFAGHPSVSLFHYGAYDDDGKEVSVIFTALVLGKVHPLPDKPSIVPEGYGAFGDGEVFIVQDYRRMYPAYVVTYSVDTIKQGQ